MLKSLLTAGALTLATLPATSQELLDFSNFKQMEDLLRGYGSVEIDVDGEGIPMFTGRMSGNRYSLVFYDCEGMVDCTTGLFVAYFDGDDYNTNLAVVNDFNSQYRFGKVSVDGDGDLEVNMAFSFKGGMSREAFDDTFDWWDIVMQEVEKHFE